MRRKNGFTFIELIIVLAIIAIFTAILVPTWGYFLDRSRTRSNNSRARIIFNAAQTAVVETQANESKWHLNGTVEHGTYIPATGDFYFYYNGNRGFRCDSAGNEDVTFRDDAGDRAVLNARFANTINRILEDPGCAYKIYVHDSKVEAVSAGRYATDEYIGIYPVTIQEREDSGAISAADRRAIRNSGIINVDLEDFSV